MIATPPVAGASVLSLLFGPTIERSIDTAAYRRDDRPDLVFSTGVRRRFDRHVLVGRDPGGSESLAISHRALSRRHVWIGPVGRRAAVVDTGSTNGTMVVSPEGHTTVCEAGRLVVIDPGWTIELAGVLWVRIEAANLRPTGPYPATDQAGDRR